jgi:hypothetical protein
MDSYEQLKNERKQGAGKLYRVPEDATLNDIARILEGLVAVQKPMARALKYLLTNNKKDVERDLTLHEIEAILTIFNDPAEIKPLSEDIHEVIRQWAAECGLNNRWVKALKGFADAGGNVRWYDGFPHPGRQPDFEIYDKFWALIEKRVTLTALKEATKSMLGISRIVNY